MDSIKFYSTVTPTLKRHMLFRGTCIAGIGILILSWGGMFLPPAVLNIWGLPLLALGIGLIAWGMIPYRRLCRLESTPDILVFDKKGITLVRRGKALFTVPNLSIEKMEYIEDRAIYGIAIWLKEPIPQKIVVYDPRFDMVRHQATMRKSLGCPLFLAHFSRRTYTQLKLV